MSILKWWIKSTSKANWKLINFVSCLLPLYTARYGNFPATSAPGKQTYIIYTYAGSTCCTYRQHATIYQFLWGAGSLSIFSLIVKRDKGMSHGSCIWEDNGQNMIGDERVQTRTRCYCISCWKPNQSKLFGGQEEGWERMKKRKKVVSCWWNNASTTVNLGHWMKYNNLFQNCFYNNKS